VDASTPSGETALHYAAQSGNARVAVALLQAGADPGRRSARAARGRLSALGVFLCKSVFYGAFVWARRALNSQERRFPARAGRNAFGLTPMETGCA
jgi:ankyrin repeat protein